MNTQQTSLGLKIIQSGFITLSLGYFIHFIYRFWDVGFYAFTWHTHLAVPFAGVVSTTLFYKFFRSLNVLFLVWCFFSVLFLSELTLHITGWVNTYSEELHGKYIPPFIPSGDLGYYWTDPPKSEKHLKAKEFHFIRHTNEYGYSDIRWNIEEIRQSTFTILCLGDSFTEGDGAHQDSSYVAFLRRKLHKSFSSEVRVLNAGKCGSDPFFNYVSLRDRLTAFEPEVIIQTVSTHDITDDIALRGGMERFKTDTTVEFSGNDLGSFARFVYTLSYTSRVFFMLSGYNELLIDSESRLSNYQEEVRKLISMFEDYSAHAESLGAQVLFVLLPAQHEVNLDYQVCMQVLKNHLIARKYQFIDLRDSYMLHKEHLNSFYWVQDAHHNAAGYELMANSIYPEVIKVIEQQRPETCTDTLK